MRVPDEYLEYGITALSRGGSKDWFDGHFGAALLAAYYMARENELPEHVTAGLIRICDTYLRDYADWFVPFPSQPSQPELLQRVVAGLQFNTARLSTSGHGVTLGTLALKALRDRPDMITPDVVNGIYEMLESAAHDQNHGRYVGVANYMLEPPAPDEIPVYRGCDDMVRRSFDELTLVIPDQKYGHKHYFFAGELEHGITHAHALADLEKLGYADLVEQGMLNHRLQMRLNRQIPDKLADQAITEPQVQSIFDPGFWSKFYKDPHAIKVPYAALSLLKLLSGEKREKAERDVCKLMSLMR